MNTNEIVELALGRLLKDLDYLDKSSAFLEGNDRRMATVVNSRNRTIKSILDCIYLLENPRHRSASGSPEKDLASAMKACKEREEKEGTDKVQLMTYKFFRGGRRKGEVRKTTNIQRNFEKLARRQQKMRKRRNARR